MTTKNNNNVQSENRAMPILEEVAFSEMENKEEDMHTKLAEIVLSIILIIISLFILWKALNFNDPLKYLYPESTSSMLVILWSGILCLLSIIYFISSISKYILYKKNKKYSYREASSPFPYFLGRVFPLIITTILYGYFIKKIHFLPLTILFIFNVNFILGSKNVKQVVIRSFMSSIILWLFFVYFMRLSL